MRFRAEQHLRRQSEFRDAREKGRRQDCGAFTLWYFRRPTAATDADPGSAALNRAAVRGPRVGVIASTAAVGCAVKRNRAKRRLREVFRHQQTLVPADVDLLLIARSALNRLEYREIEQKFIDACRKLFPSAS